MKSIKYIIIYLIIIQFALPFFFSFDKVFHYRMDYNVVKDNLHDIDTVLDKIKIEINKKKLKDYIVILGDSVPYSGPGNSNQSIGYYMNKLSKEAYGENAPVIFNLSMPAMQTGDIYTMLLKLDERGISTDNLIIDVAYSGFLNRNPDPPIVFWLKEDLKKVDEETFNEVLPQLKANGYKEPETLFKKFQQSVADAMYVSSIYKYKDFIIREAEFAYKRIVRGEQIPDDSLGDARVWSEKEGLRELLEKPEYMNGFSDQSFDMSQNNPQILFLEKILEHQKNKNTLVFLIATNEELMKPEVTKQGYKDNLAKIDEYFSTKPVTYINLQGEIEQQLFTDHVHLTSEGYKKLSQILWNQFEGIRGKQ